VQQQRLPSLLDPPVAFAHRGARAHAPENTIAAFQLALRLGATGLESDVWLTADGVAVLDHDGVVKRRGRRIPLSAVYRDDLPEHVPTLADMLRSCPGGFDLSLDVKDPTAVDAVIESPPDYVLTAKVFDMIVAAPKYGKVKATRLLNQCRISQGKTLGGLSERQRGELVELLRLR